MQREIKFRAWNKNQNCMMKSEPSYHIPSYWMEDHCILMQYTGLKDKNGKEIYEGDVVKANDRDMYKSSIIGEVKYGDGWYYISSKVKTLAFTEVWLGNGFGEVVGNIYENPELLK